MSNINSIKNSITIFELTKTALIPHDLNAENGVYFEQATISNNVFSPLLCTAVIEITFDGLKTFNTNSPLFQGGNVVQFFSNSVSIFIGYIATIQKNINQDGQTIIINCSSLLGQLATQTISAYNERTKEIEYMSGIFANSFARNKVPLSSILLFMTSNTLMSLALKNNNALKSFPIRTTTGSIKLPFLLENLGDGLEYNTDVYFMASPENNKLSALIECLNAYQRVIYQDFDGVIKITAPKMTKSDNTIIFDNMNQFSNKENTYKADSFTINDNFGIAPNRLSATLISNVGVTTTNKIEQSAVAFVATPGNKYFARLNELRESGVFEISATNNPNLTIQEFVQNPFLINLIDQSIKNNQGVQITNASKNQNNTVVKGYAQAGLASMLSNVLTINLTTDLAKLKRIPFAEPVIIQSNQNDDEYYCYQFVASFSSQNTMLHLTLCRPYTNTPKWII